MKPETSLPQFNVERTSIQPEDVIDRTPNTVDAKPNIEIGGSERYERSAEASAAIADIGLSTALPAPVITNDKSAATKDSPNTSVPITASDDNLIEREWVDRAKKIVADTQNDPHQRENEVSKLQIDYIKKRYGRELGVAD